MVSFEVVQEEDGPLPEDDDDDSTYWVPFDTLLMALGPARHSRDREAMLGVVCRSPCQCSEVHGRNALSHLLCRPRLTAV